MPNLQISSIIDDNSKDLIEQIAKSTSNHSFFCYLKKKRELKRKLNFQKFLVKYNDKISKNKEKYILPPNSIVERYLELPDFYFEDTYINTLFANLLSAASNIDTIKQAHPSYVSIIKDLSPYDARLLNDVLSLNYMHPIAKIRHQIKSNPSLDLPSCFRYLKNGFDYLTHCFPLNPSEYLLELTSRSLGNLERLGIIEIHYDFLQTNSNGYDELATSQELISLLKEYEEYTKNELDPTNYENKEICLIPGIILFTEYGKDFIEICCQ